MTRVKICGMRREEDILAANAIRPDYVGFICSAPYWRFIPREEAGKLADALDPGIHRVGVFVDEPPEWILSYIKKGIIDMVQLHGHEDDAYIKDLRALMGRVPIIKAVKIRSSQDIERARACSADYVLLDQGTGEGRSFDWNLIRDMDREYFLAGGLNCGNIKEALERFKPYAVDASSGVETDRVKDADKMRAFVEIVRVTI